MEPQSDTVTPPHDEDGAQMALGAPDGSLARGRVTMKGAACRRALPSTASSAR